MADGSSTAPRRDAEQIGAVVPDSEPVSPRRTIVSVEEWGSERAAELTALVGAVLPHEDLSLDELLACCWEDPEADTADLGTVIATPDGAGAVAVVLRSPDAAGGEPQAYVKLVVVHPDARRAGRGHRLLAAAEDWAGGHGAGSLHLAGSPPFYLWPGV